MSFENTVAVISGGASGLGLGVAKRIVDQGGKAAILDLNAEQGEAIAAQAPEQLLFIQTDISNEAQVDAAVDKAAEHFGKVNLAVGCAGILGAGRVISKKGPMPADYFQKVVNINLVGSFLLTRAAARHMQNNDPVNNERGVIIHTASIAAFEGQLGQVAYSATKSAIVGMMLPLAREFARSGIRCMAIAPGTFDTQMMAQVPDEIRQQLAAEIPFPPRFGDADEFASLVQHINENQMLNGTVIRIDGAQRMR
ncbi:SDR family NAD(P)-dependent oxidoreductase [Aliikangiella marina]|uniref:SDR family NAD(P)-dependent oxidoreductase n=1 Tax=Aliikangiella marina TaxID=1712262 RepID=A0A545TDE4_9GAMM|nr:SDR family NAD(P)-dependent oxidoreductase [Aliikangiella marina]TQV75244.1 SDR family NAD(P)-dependent oxidoreductase [Aliikangiella marina]